MIDGQPLWFQVEQISLAVGQLRLRSWSHPVTTRQGFHAVCTAEATGTGLRRRRGGGRRNNLPSELDLDFFSVEIFS